nr:flap endonuclease GEN homolog 1 isoform X1 [Paramormyrops kingsleyae]XP_023662748.1 flap endonuclease GEN homolog 1 isoform X1 [Paramormyrops kingsleyae]XP_023662749.1 flap endonuclease GEN homolog 1 isoform X1 [Paramormyrops kingsleyae]
MGVSDLWSILEPVRESVPLYSLAGKTLAVDLSLWVCESQSVKEMAGRVAKPHLRNLFFRVSALTLMGIKLIFVLEGEAPQIKAETMSKRTALRFGPSRKPAPKPAQTGRSRFKFVLRECAEMLDCLGIPWVTAKGEAEAMCAFLDSSGSVDGCITNDGDVFLYGGQTVYRNFNMNTKDPQVDCYKMERVRTELHLERETLVGLAILLGCDYVPKGIAGVGKELTLKLIQTLSGQTLLQKFRQWSDDDQEMPERRVKKVTHCPMCRHPGTAKAHQQRGCGLCGSTRFCEPQDYDYLCPCDWHRAELTWQSGTVESIVKRKALACKGFPFTEVIHEFLVPKDRHTENITRRKPNLLLMQNFALEKLEWPKHYTSEKVLVLMTYTEMMNIKCGRRTSSPIEPLRICKTRVRNGIASFEIIWKKPEHFLHPGDCPDELRDVVTTIEEESLFRSAYPGIVERFLNEKEEAEQNKQKQKKRRNGKRDGTREGSDDVSEMFALMNLHGCSEGKVDSATGKQSTSPSSNGSSDHSRSTEQGQAPPAGCSGLGPPPRAPANEDSPSKPPSFPGTAPTTVSSSPSESTIIGELHLSEIDWDACSFSSSPQTQSGQRGETLPASPSLEEHSIGVLGHCRAPGGEPVNPSGVRHPNRPSAVSCSEDSLRCRVLVKNATGHQKVTADVITRTHQTQGLRSIPSSGSSSTPSQPLAKVNHTAKLLQRAQTLPTPPGGSDDARKGTESSLCGPEGTHITTQKSEDPRLWIRPSPKYRFVRTKDNAGAGHHGNSRGKKTRAVKKSVCDGLCSSSDDSNAENVPVVRKTTTVKGKPGLRYPHGADHQQRTGDRVTPHVTMKGTSDWDRGGCGPAEDGNTMVPSDLRDVTQSPSCQTGPSEGDDSVISLDSPLPLAERLKLRFI